MGKYNNYCSKCGTGLFEGQFQCPVCTQRAHENRMAEINAPKKPSDSKSSSGCMLIFAMTGAAVWAALSGWIL